jgi:hypothetical protein
MADDDDYDEDGDEEDEDEEDDEDEDEGEDEEEEEDEEDEEAKAEAKLKSVKEDIDTLLDLSIFVDRTSKRLRKRLTSNYEEREKEDKYLVDRRGERDDGEGGEFEMPVWQNYEQMDESERASLLERAIMVLAEDRSEGAGAPHDRDRDDRDPRDRGTGGLRGSRIRQSGGRW